MPLPRPCRIALRGPNGACSAALGHVCSSPSGLSWPCRPIAGGPPPHCRPPRCCCNHQGLDAGLGSTARAWAAWQPHLGFGAGLGQQKQALLALGWRAAQSRIEQRGVCCSGELPGRAPAASNGPFLWGSMPCCGGCLDRSSSSSLVRWVLVHGGPTPWGAWVPGSPTGGVGALGTGGITSYHASPAATAAPRARWCPGTAASQMCPSPAHPWGPRHHKPWVAALPGTQADWTAPQAWPAGLDLVRKAGIMRERASVEHEGLRVAGSNPGLGPCPLGAHFQPTAAAGGLAAGGRRWAAVGKMHVLYVAVEGRPASGGPSRTTLGPPSRGPAAFLPKWRRSHPPPHSFAFPSSGTLCPDQACPAAACAPPCSSSRSATPSAPCPLQPSHDDHHLRGHRLVH